ncbi:MAG TPA: hypothetical protein VJ246_00155 [Patescibacteria group bacterium]|nr:hypothetical protein [Patescibacteria group bacterium]
MVVETPQPKKPSGPNLSDVAFGARLLIKYGAIFLVFLMIGRIVLNMTVTLYMTLNPPKPPGPTYGFGTLPPVKFPEIAPVVQSYELQTRTGTLPLLETQLPVFFMPLQTIGLLSLDEAKREAAALGFVFAPEQTSPTIYRWRKSSPLPATLDIDIVSKSFTLKVDWTSDPGFLSDKSLPQQAFTITNTRETLQEADLLAPDIATSDARVGFLKASGLAYAPAVSFSEADFIQVDVFRLPIRQRYPILGPSPSKGNARFIFSGKREAGINVVEASYYHAPIEYERFETYGLISPQQAWQMMQNGQGFVANIDEGVTHAIVRNVSLAYYDSETPQNYLQPVYVFTGDQNFYGYVPAVLPPSQSSKL